MYKNVFIVLILYLIISILSAQDLTPIEMLGKNIFFDKISDPDWMSCATCHAPEVGFTGPIAGINAHGAVYRGAVSKRFGNRKPPSAAYATLSPIFKYDEDEELFVGGNFWDGRATGADLGNPAADQALGPFLNPVEQNNASKEAVLMQIAESKYADLWETVWDEPVSYDEMDVEENYDRVGLSIAAYESSSDVNQFSSKYDLFLAGQVELSEQETNGLELFNGKGLCSLCHISEPDFEGNLPLFTDFTYDNLGTPKNPENPFYDMDQIFLDNGSPINPEGSDWVDPGLGGFLASLDEEYFDDLGLDKTETVAGNWGKHKVPTLRNVAKSSGNNFPKAYMHNGVFKSLEEVVHFYNTRDVEDWPEPEVAMNVNTDELGDLGLTMEEEEAIVAFMKTLSDGYDPAKDKVKNNKSATFAIRGANPFNPTTSFTYSITEDANVQIYVYNALGQKVATLMSSYKPAGTYQIEFNAANLSSGIYFVQFSTENSILTQKISLLK
jgi:cytochrome c peroxidase